jgi:hypothetical protein
MQSRRDPDAAGFCSAKLAEVTYVINLYLTVCRVPQEMTMDPEIAC